MLASFLFFLIWRVSLTHPVLASFFNLGSFSYTSRAGFFSSFFFLSFFQGIFSYTSRAGFIFIWGVSLTHPVLALLCCGKFLLHIPCWLHFYLGSFSYTSRVRFTFIWVVSLTHSMLALLFCGRFLFHIPC